MNKAIHQWYVNLNESIADLKEYHESTPIVGASPTSAILAPVMAAKVIANIVPYIVTIVGVYSMWFVGGTFFAWLLEAFGILEFPWLWEILDPNAGTDNTLADQWVELNTSWVGIAIDTVAKS